MNNKLKENIQSYTLPKRQWEDNYIELKRYFESNGHTDIPRCKEYSKLYKWIARQRFNKTILSEKQIKNLDQLKFVWNPREKHWQNQFNKLCLFYSEHKHYNVPISYIKDPEFGRWVRRQRATKEEMLEERKQQLDAINFSWNVREEIWETYYKRVNNYIYKHKEQPSYSSNYELYSWIKRQKEKSFQGKLNKEKTLLLQQLTVI